MKLRKKVNKNGVELLCMIHTIRQKYYLLKKNLSSDW